jgi:hypothetical protein
MPAQIKAKTDSDFHEHIAWAMRASHTGVILGPVQRDGNSTYREVLTFENGSER